MKIGNKGLGNGVYVIAEAGVNHNGSLERAKELIKAASQAGADAIKFQTYTADELVCKGTPKFWKSEGGDVGNDQYEAYAKLGGFPYELYPELIKYCDENNIEFLSTPFSFEAADKLNEMGVRAFKIASSDMSHLPFLKHIAEFNKPILLSTGASTMEEVREAVKTIESTGNTQIVILHCTLKYPTEPADANFNVMRTLQKEFIYPVGLSDHTLGVFPSVVAMSLGALVIEKHFTLDKTLPDSADHWLSLDPAELKELCCFAKDIDLLRGSYKKEVLPCEKETRIYDKRSIVSKVTIPKGTEITEEMITYKRPGSGIWPKYYKQVIGSIAKEHISEDRPITWEDIEV